MVATNLLFKVALYNKCVILGHYPTIWMQAAIYVVKKPLKENYRILKSYRIGQLPVFGKVLEKVISSKTDVASGELCNT